MTVTEELLPTCWLLLLSISCAVSYLWNAALHSTLQSDVEQRGSYKVLERDELAYTPILVEIFLSNTFARSFLKIRRGMTEGVGGGGEGGGRERETERENEIKC